MRNLRLSISNIAWDPSEDKDIAAYLKLQKIDAIDIAPSKYFSKDMSPNKSQISKVRNFWESYGIEIVGMQSLLFGTSGLNLFGEVGSREKMLDHLTKVAHIAQELGVKNLVFGSPKNRDRTGLTEEETFKISNFFFNQLGDIGHKYNVRFTIEPNPKIYSCNFITNSIDAFNLTSTIEHPNIKMQLDTGTIVTNSENYSSEIPLYKNMVGHIHLSTTHLKPIHTDKTRLIPIFESLNENFKSHVVTIEMLSSNKNDIYESILFSKEHIK